MPNEKQLQIGEGLASFTSGDTLVVLWKKGASPERWAWWMAQMQALAARSSADGVVGLMLITADSSPPDAKVRKRAQTDFRELKDKLRKFVVVPLGSSVWQSVVRTIVRGTLLLSGLSDRQKVASTISDGIDQLRAVAGATTPSREEINAAIDAMAKGLDLGELEPGRRR